MEFNLSDLILPLVGILFIYGGIMLHKEDSITIIQRKRNFYSKIPHSRTKVYPVKASGKIVKFKTWMHIPFGTLFFLTIFSPN